MTRTIGKVCSDTCLFRCISVIRYKNKPLPSAVQEVLLYRCQTKTSAMLDICATVLYNMGTADEEVLLTQPKIKEKHNA
jgi:hypothetical protein|tara:strand:- start:412 stop:648 length:237 start_codon:yes stop_codon:yes gene_type:complete